MCRRPIALWEKLLLWELTAVGVLGGVAATVSAVSDIVNDDTFTAPCYLQ